MSKFCTSCGSPLQEKDQFCPNCGLQIEITKTRGENQNSTPSTLSTPKRKNNLPAWIFLGVIVLVFLFFSTNLFSSLKGTRNGYLKTPYSYILNEFDVDSAY